jgi:hypothetical protein
LGEVCRAAGRDAGVVEDGAGPGDRRVAVLAVVPGRDVTGMLAAGGDTRRRKRNEAGRNAIELAREAGHREVVDVLEREKGGLLDWL